MSKESYWIIKNFSKLVQRYAGKCIAVIGNKVVAVAKDEKSAEKASRRIYL